MKLQTSVSLVIAFSLASPVVAAEADLILFNGKIIRVDGGFSIAHAVAVKDGKIAAGETPHRTFRVVDAFHTIERTAGREDAPAG